MTIKKKMRFVHSLVTPGLVKKIIIFALQKGWIKEQGPQQMNISCEHNEFTILSAM
ncbi:MAG: hypothetical protein JXB88_12040 [Spirochaetales bacterium]|nr:hypothetical protein [Spirochaetales bacterium]